MYLANEDFNSVYSKVPRLCVDLVFRGKEGVLLALRNIEPYYGFWHFPGGTVYKGETLFEAAIRIAKEETGLDVVPQKSLGYLEFLNETRNGIHMHTVSVLMEVFVEGGTATPDKNTRDLAWFADLPERIVAEHRDFLIAGK